MKYFVDGLLSIALVLFIASLVFGSDPKPATAPVLAQYPQQGEAVRPVAAAPAGPTKITPGKFRSFFIDFKQGPSQAVTWDVTFHGTEPDETKRPAIADTLPRTTLVYATAEGTDAIARHSFPEGASDVLVVTGLRPGTLTAKAFIRDGDTFKKFTEVVIEVTGARPPPVVPVNPPVNPPVTDPLVKRFQEAISKDADKALLPQFIAVMRESMGLANQPTYGDSATLAGEVAKRTNKAVGAGGLKAIRDAVGEVLDADLPTDNQALTPELRGRVGACYAKIVAALEKLQ